MLPEDQVAWDDYSKRARTRLRRNALDVVGRGCCSLQAVVEPAFDNEVAWTLGKATEGPMCWRVVRSIWGMQQDILNFSDPLARLRTSGQPPSIKSQTWTVESKWAEDLITSVSRLSPTDPSDPNRIVLDQTRYELRAELDDPLWQFHWTQLNPEPDDPVLIWMLGALGKFEALF